MKIFKLSEYKQLIKQFIKSGLTSKEIAIGIALGNFVGILPFIGLHTVMSIGCAYIFRLNPLIVIIGSNISNPISFPFILFISAQIGSLLLNGGFLSIKLDGNIIDIVNYYLLPTILGSILLGIVAGCVSYFLVLKMVSRYNSYRGGFVN